MKKNYLKYIGFGCLSIEFSYHSLFMLINNYLKISLASHLAQNLAFLYNGCLIFPVHF